MALAANAAANGPAEGRGRGSAMDQAATSAAAFAGSARSCLAERALIIGSSYRLCHWRYSARRTKARLPAGTSSVRDPGRRVPGTVRSGTVTYGRCAGTDRRDGQFRRPPVVRAAGRRQSEAAPHPSPRDSVGITLCAVLAGSTATTMAIHQRASRYFFFLGVRSRSVPEAGVIPSESLQSWRARPRQSRVHRNRWPAPACRRRYWDGHCHCEQWRCT